MGRRSQKSRTGQQARERFKHSVKETEGSDDNGAKSVDISAAGGNDSGKRKKARALKSESEGDFDGDEADAIAAGYASIEVDQNPQTCCSNCKTIFEVSKELLSSSDTRVRCGECLSIFDALANLRQPSDEEAEESDSESSDENAQNVGEESTGDGHSVASSLPDASAAALAGLANNASPLDVTYADFSLFSADAALQNVDYLDETVEVQSFDFDDPAGDDELDDTYSETLFAQGPEVDARSAINETDSGSVRDATLVIPAHASAGILVADTGAEEEGALEHHDDPLSDTIAGDGVDELLESLERAQAQKPPVEVRKTGSWRFKGALLLLAVSLAVALYGYRERQSLQNSRYVRPLLEVVCSVTGCTLEEQVDLDSLQVLKRSVFSHPTIEDALLINIGFINKASFGQRYPVLEIRLTDRNGRLVVKNSFEPSDYLDNWQQGDVFAAGKQLDVTLNLDDPGNEAMSFELDFR
ncbi:zinc-ribbon and DUF3426 domain-containing protein [Granulosicoccus antarcticus]|uniref:Zinc finger/thioredoxin putative domain-containing protein n=1 Tax=Granulosicoccus antarcticus IMCC3135 TaxID=1192854 RepID=A0A2Z2NJE2_9GAMM|nr:zinc-ribbon and DUF3426 domain-containing protein [Granulosicoccus antarcticus]ASJ71426.1 hypothetical protein IMCC3135_06595 [Granulosicoccus antarcticus IMCC3135]